MTADKNAKVSPMFRFGMQMQMPKCFETVEYYGRGPVENYSDPDLLRVGFNASLGDNEPQEHASGHPEDTLFGIELHAFCLETLECHFKVGKEVGGGLLYRFSHTAGGFHGGGTYH